MKSKIVFCVSLLMLVQAVASAQTIAVPSRTYQTIQAGIDVASNGDIVEVAPNPNPYYPVAYTGQGNINLDFHNKAITVRSQINPNNPNWDVINSTIIDCCGMPTGSTAADGGLANRAFWFHSGEGAGSQVIGFTIKNGYARGPKGKDANAVFIGNQWLDYPDPRSGGTTVPWQTSPSITIAITSNPVIDPCTLPPAALDGCDVSGNGYGGAILCNNSSPTISYCVIENCTATGALGGKGANGLSGQWSYYTWADFNWADGNTYHMLLPTATLKNTTNGQGAGNGGNGSGNGYGGAIAMRGTCSPKINSCRFINNSAQGGQGGAGGRGGNAGYPPSYNSGLEGGGGNAGDSDGDGIGGAIYAETSCQPDFNECLFEDNVAKTGPRGQAGGRGLGNANIITTNGVGTRVSSGQSSIAFTSPNPAIAGGAAYFANNSGPTFTDCNFINNKAYVAFFYDPNTEPGYEYGTGYWYVRGIPSYSEGTAEDIMGYTVGGAVYFGNGCVGTINTCDFIENGGDALYFGQGCNFSINNGSAVGRGQPGRKNLFQGNNAPDDIIEGYYTVSSSGSGGAIYVNPSCSMNISNSIFNENTAKTNGGAIESQSDLTISDCAFSGNIARGSGDSTGFGGAVDVYSGSNLAINATNCSFISNKSIWGGALSTEIFHGSFNNCIFTDNTAQIGGALDLSMGQSTVTIADCSFGSNIATSGDGGGIYCFYTSAAIQNCEFFDNSAEGTLAYGGGIDIYGAPSPVNSHIIKNCLFVGNSSSYDGGAITCESYVNPQILDCTFSQNTAAQFGGAVFVDWGSNPTIKDCIIQKSNNHAIHEEDAGGNATATYCLFFDNPDGHYYDSGTQLVYYDADISSIPGGSNNLVGDPLFVTGNLGDYYLSQTTAGQLSNSPAVNSGSTTALALGLNTKTTATNDAVDTGTVDIGYHFRRAVDMPQFHLTTNVVGGIGTISVLPAPLPDGNYYAGTVVTVTAQPQANWVIKQWTGTDNDSEVTATQKVVMNSNRAVTVEFKQPTFLYVGPYSSYADITAAMAAANDGDIIVVSSGLYPSSQIQFAKSVEVRSQNPDNPAWVANTIIDFSGHGSACGIFFPQRANSGCVLNGFTIRNSNWTSVPGDDGTNLGENGGDALGGEGGAIWIGPGAGPVIKNCVIRDNSIQAGNGANGANADLYHNAGRGGWGGWARGGAVYCSVNSHPQFINCQILNNRVVGGSGGNGGNEAAVGGNANYGGNWSRAEWWDYDPRDISQDWVQGDLYQRWTELAPDIPLNTIGKVHRGSTNYQDLDDYGTYHYGYIGDYRWYSGYGGGVYVNTGSNVTFTNCIISNNLAEGGFSGLGGTDSTIEPYKVGPLTRYEIPAFGGGVYVAATSNVVFNGCVISNNAASNPTYYAASNRIDSYLGHGGGVCAEDTAKVTFVDCNFTSNNASVGGGLFGSNASLVLSDCEFMSNRAYQGGGMFGQNGSISINKSIFNSNTAPDDANDPNVLGEGGGLHFLSAQTNIADTNITGNSAEAMGGGIIIKGGGGSALLRNCLLTNNSAGMFGGAVAATIFAQLEVANCTIVNNIANLGGGLLSSEGGYINVINSIIWDNRAGLGANGSQIAVSGTEPPAAMQVRYSDVQDSNDPCAWSNNINALDFVICFDTTGSMGGDISAVRTAASQIVNAIAAQYPDYRLGLVDFRDYPDGNHGALGDWAYRDRVKFTTDANMLISGLQPMVAGGGGDGPEAIYTALMHSIDANALVARLTADGYTNYIDSNSSGLGDWRQGNKVMRVILLLTDASPHDPEPYTNYVLNDIVTAANGRNPIHIIPVVIRGDTTAEDALRLVANGTGGTLIPATDSNAVPGAVLDAIALLSQIPAPIFIAPGGTINWDPTTFTWEPNSHNINADPLFIGGFFLSQIDAGQLINSPCWNTGSAGVNSPDINLGGYTTRTDGVNDVNIVDMGYHYPASFVPPQYHLTILPVDGLTSADVTPGNGDYVWFTKVSLHVSAAPPAGYQIVWTGTDDDAISDGNNSVRMTSDKTVTVGFGKNTCNLTVTWNDGGTVTPADGTYPRGTNVVLTATPDAGYRVESWEGTDNDGLFTRTNTVTMNGDRTVRVKFSLPQTVTVPGSFTTIQEAVTAARSGDIVVVSSGVYHGNTIVLNKEITLASTNPDDPCVVAATIIDSTGFASPAMIFYTGATVNTVVNGFTITSGTYQVINSQNATTAGQNGPDGRGIQGGAVYVFGGTSPTIKNCVIRDTFIRGGNAGNGGNADATTPAGRGGWGGWARGGGVYVAPFANPTLINTTITNCTVTGGNAGNGGNSSGAIYGAPDYQDANFGGLWSNDFGFPWWELTDSNGQPYLGDYTTYSGHGGGVFCDSNSSATFIDCNITNNIARGGLSGVGGTRPQGIVIPDPVTAYRIPSYGGGIYCANDSNVNLVGCTIGGNIAPKPDTTYHIDPYLGHGGGIAFEDTASIRLQNGTISDNNSAVGGGMFWAGGQPEVIDCNIINNNAYVGGGIYATESSGQIRGCTMRNNFAGVSPNDVDVIAGEGGGMFGSSIDIVIADCFLTNNTSSTSGGGIHIYGLGDANTIIRNCLLTGNQAGRDGGGISANWGAVVLVENCTLYDNQATGLFGIPGDTGFGGGLSGAYDNTHIDIMNSIIWNNISPEGSQVAVDASSSVRVRFSDVGKSVVVEGELIEPNSLPVIRSGFDSNTLAANDDDSAGPINIGFMLNFFGNQYSQLFVNNNGNVTFDANMTRFTPFGLTSNIGTSIIAPFFADVDTRVGNLTAYGPNTIDGHAAFGATWNNVGYFSEHIDKLDSFQVVLIDRADRAPGDFDIEFNYEQILWEAGDASGGTNGFGGSSAHAGFSNGTGVTGTFYEFEGSGVPGALLDSNPITGLIHNSRRSVVLGRYIFEVHGGLPTLLSGEPFYAESNSIDGFVWSSDSNSWEPNSGSHNINTDPCFAFNGAYYLSQIDAGQLINSPCWNAGSADVNSPDINLAGYTTRTDSVPDVCTVDMGYHYPLFAAQQYSLAIEVNGVGGHLLALGKGDDAFTIVDPNSRRVNANTVVSLQAIPDAGYSILRWTGTSNDAINDVNNSVVMNGNKTVTVAFIKSTCDLTVEVVGNHGGTVTPTSGTYPRGTAVTLTATPDAGYRIASWEGTDNDGLFTRTNTVTMNVDKTVRVTFSLPQTRTVPGDFTTIQEAVEVARSGDIVSVSSGVYRGSTIVLNKEITLTSTNPDDPCVVAATIIDSTGYQGGLALLFSAGATANTVVDGFTITSGTYKKLDAQNAAQAGQNGPDGGGIAGGAVYVDTGASPTLRNCVIRDTNITAGNAGSGGNADATIPGGRGGWGGWARGGGIYVAPFANPTLVSCTITNCSVTGGNGGNGGNSTGTFGQGYQDANYGGLWSNEFSFPWQRMVGADGEPCYIGDYRFYSGYGGGVFCDANSEANFIGCDVTNNTARGGISGVGGTRPGGAFIPDPVTAYRIPSYGGGVYCGANSDINFVGCTISGNVAPRPDATYHTDPYLGHGGGIAFEDTASIRFQNCTISDNNSAVGGGMFWAGGEPEVLNCDIMRNTAYLGGGIYAMESAGQISGCTLLNNFAGVSPGDVDLIAGQGGGIFGSSIDTTIVDCLLTNNTSSTSGAGIHIYGPGDANTIIRNCLLTGNQAGRDGGGISTNWGAVVSVENCTLYNNLATGTFGDVGNTGFGGGLYCSYEAQTNVKNSIFWDNNSISGKEIAEGIGFVESGLTDKYYCGTISVSYSDIQDGNAGVLVSNGCPLIWGLGNKNIDPCFVNAVSSDFHLEQISAGQMLNSPCIDAGDGLAVSLGMFKYSTSTLGTSDTGIVDLGYHYPISEYCRKWDLYVDNLIDFRDFAVFASAWVNGLGDAGYGRDDLKEFTYCWLEQLAADMNAPTPNPMTWALLPHAITGNSVEMRASTAVDVSGQVYYQFEEVNGPTSTWQTNTYYVFTGLNPTGEYCFMVRARDKYNNATDWSEPVCVNHIGDVNAPTPAPTFVPVAAQNITRQDANTASGQFEWDPVNFQWDWWHRVIVDVTGVTDDITQTSELEVRFICSSSGYSSDNVIPATYLPIRIGHPVAIGGRIPDGSGAASGSYRLTWNGTNRIVYEVYVDAVGGSYGRQLSWHVCVYDESNNAACTPTNTIPQ